MKFWVSESPINLGLFPFCKSKINRKCRLRSITPLVVPCQQEAAHVMLLNGPRNTCCRVAHPRVTWEKKNWKDAGNFNVSWGYEEREREGRCEEAGRNVKSSNTQAPTQHNTNKELTYIRPAAKEHIIPLWPPSRNEKRGWRVCKD